MFFILHRAVEKFFDFGVEGGQPTASFGGGEVNGLISSRGDNVEFWIKDINAVHNTVESRKGKGCVRLILSNSVLAVKVFEQ